MSQLEQAYGKRLKPYLLDTGLTCWLFGWNTLEQLAKGAAWGYVFEAFVVAEILKGYYNDRITRASLYYYRDKERNEIDLVTEEGEALYPVEIKVASDPTALMMKSFKYLDGVPEKTRGEGAVMCLAKQCLPLSDAVWAIPANS